VLDHVPPTLRRVVTRRFDGLSTGARASLRVLAANGPAAAPTIARLVNPDIADPCSDPSIGEAVRRGVLVVDDDDLLVRFVHTLFAAAALDELDPLERQALHGRLAATATDPDARARHLARSRVEPDGNVAAELDEAAQRHSRRGAAALAAELTAHSARLTPPDDLAGRFRRTLTSIVHRATAGERASAIEQCDGVLGMLPPGPARAEAIALRVGLDFTDGERFLTEAASTRCSPSTMRRLLPLGRPGRMAARTRSAPVESSRRREVRRGTVHWPAAGRGRTRTPGRPRHH
jgi:hypothetical protein